VAASQILTAFVLCIVTAVLFGLLLTANRTSCTNTQRDLAGFMSIADHLGRINARAADTERAAGVAHPAREVVDLLDVPGAAWRDLAARAADANIFYDPDWALSVARHAEDMSGAKALLVWDGGAHNRLIGLLPVVSAWRSFKIPVPVLVAWQAYAPLTTPLIDRDALEEGAQGLIAAASEAGAFGLLLPALAEESATAEALRNAITKFGKPIVLNRHRRACFDATQPVDAALEQLGAKKLKELRRQRNRLADNGAVTFDLPSTPERTVAALEDFLSLEAAGWKGARGTALGQKDGDRSFIREAMTRLAQTGNAQLATLICAGRPVAAGIVLRHMRRGYFFKIAHDEAAEKMSPGVQLTLDVTRALCADTEIDSVDSMAVAGHPMIDHVWRDRIAICDVLLPLQRAGVAFAAIRLSITARYVLRESAKWVVRFLRSLKPAMG
jgi:CelD/BcsL family acetyltransferase involved in cellulose biosynthesis